MTRSAADFACDEACKSISKAIGEATSKIEEHLSTRDYGWAKDAAEVVVMLSGSLAELRGPFSATPDAAAPELKSSFSEES